MNPIIKNFIESNRLQKLSLISCGFELETQETEGFRAEDGEFDEIAFDQAVDDQVDDICSRSRIEDYVSTSLWEDILSEVRDSVVDGMDREDYTSNGIDNVSYIGNDLIQVGTDGSVDGFEFRTRGALKVSKFMEAAKRVFSFSHEIDDGCSFHIHLSLNGVSHQYGERLQLGMVEYISEAMDRLPAAVQKRIKNFRNNSYIAGIKTSGKYCLVNFNQKYSTWEFRCFGNVQNYREAYICLGIAVEALAYAYKVRFSGEKFLAEKVTEENFTYATHTPVSLIGEAIEKGFKISKIKTPKREAI